MGKLLVIAFFCSSFMLVSFAGTTSAPAPVPTALMMKPGPNTKPIVTEIVVHDIKFPKGGFKGKVAKIVSVKTYKYIEFDDKKTGRKLWVASTIAEIHAGDEIAIPEGTVMNDFYGDEAHMHFDFIIFTDKIKIVLSNSLNKK